MRVTAVTALYDINRTPADGRMIDDYVSWLNKTLQLPLPFLIYLDPAFDADKIVPKETDRIIRVAKEDLTMFKLRTQVEQIVKTSSIANRRDILFKLPDYGMMVMSKPDILKRAANETDADALIWIDAGHCRFIPDLEISTLQVQVDDLDGMTIGLNITRFLEQRMKIGKLPRSTVSSCLALFSAEDFIIARSFAKELSDRIDFMVETDWLPSGRWDNEQTAIGCLLFRGGLPGARILHSGVGGGGNTARWLFGKPQHRRKMELYVLWRLLRDKIHIRRTPKADCYLPGDFPEETYRAWVKARDRNGVDTASRLS